MGPSICWGTVCMNDVGSRQSLLYTYKAMTGLVWSFFAPCWSGSGGSHHLPGRGLSGPSAHHGSPMGKLTLTHTHKHGYGYRLVWMWVLVGNVGMKTQMGLHCRFVLWIGMCYEWTPMSSLFTLLQVLIHHVILTYHVISCDHFCDPLSKWLYCPCDDHCSLMFHLHQFHLFIGHHCSSDLLFSVTLLFCDTYCSSDFIVLFYYKYWQSLAL